MIWAAAKREIQKLAHRAGYRIVPKDRDAQSLREWLLSRPIGTVIDVGASRGETSREWLAAFPAATVHAIEPLPGSFAELQQLQARFPQRLHAYNFAVGRQNSTVQFNMHPGHDTSSSLLQRTDYSVEILPDTRDEQVIDVSLTTLDSLFAQSMVSMPGEILIKLDVQGVESDVIAGAAQLLSHASYILTEISLAPVYFGQSDFNTVHGALTSAGFILKGFLEQFHVSDLTPVYADVLYVNESGRASG